MFGCKDVDAERCRHAAARDDSMSRGLVHCGQRVELARQIGRASDTNRLLSAVATSEFRRRDRVDGRRSCLAPCQASVRYRPHRSAPHGRGQPPIELSDHDLPELGTDRDTGEFAVASIRCWWRAEGRHLYPKARSLVNHRRRRRELCISDPPADRRASTVQATRSLETLYQALQPGRKAGQVALR